MARRVALTFANYVSGYAVGFVVSILVARFYGAYGKGALTIAASIPAMAFEIGKIGLYNANAYFSARRPELLPQIYANSLWYAGVAGTISAGIVWLSADTLGFGSSVLAPAALAAVAVSIPFFFAYSLFSATLIGSERAVAFNGVLLGSNVIPLVLVVVCIAAGVGPDGLVALRALVPVTLATVMLPLCLRRVPTGIRLRPSGSTFRELMRYGSKPYVASLLGYVVVRADVFFVNYFLGPSAVGVYSIDGTIVLILLALPSSVGLMLMPRVARLGVVERVSYFQKACRTTIALTVSEIIVSLLLVSPAVRTIYGAGFEGAIPVYYVLAPGVLAMAVVQISMQFFSGIGYPLAAAALWLPGTIVNVVMNLILLPRLGILAAGLASTAAYSLMAALTIGYLLSRYGCSLRQLLVPRRGELRVAVRQLLHRA